MFHPLLSQSQVFAGKITFRGIWSVFLLVYALVVLYLTIKTVEPEPVVGQKESTGQAKVETRSHAAAHRHVTTLLKRTKQIRRAMGSRNTSEYVRPEVDTTLLEPVDVVSQTMGSTAIILISCLPKDAGIRDIIRSTWGTLTEKYGIRVFFFMGVKHRDEIWKLKGEATRYNDLIVELYEESYYRNAVKKLRMMKWYLKHEMELSHIKFLIECDADYYVHPPNLSKYLEQLSARGVPDTNYLGGYVHVREGPHPDPECKWYLPPGVVKLNVDGTYPDFLTNGMVVFSRKFVKTLYMACLGLPFFHLDDVWMTGYVANRHLGVVPERISGIVVVADPEGLFPGKIDYSTLIGLHCDQKIDLLVRVWDRYTKRNST